MMTATTSSYIPVATLSRSGAPRIECGSCPARHGSIFCELEAAGLAVMNGFKIVRTYAPGETLFHEGAQSSGMYCLSEGTVKIIKVGREGKEQIVRFLRPGDVIGYRALLGGEPHSSSAVALGPVRVCYIPKSAFFGVMTADPSLQSRIVRLLSEELRVTEERFVATAQHTVRQRLAEALVDLKETFGYREDGQTLDVQLRRSDIANIVGTAPESVIRMLSEFKRAGIIDIDGRDIRILRPRTLRKEAGRE